ncbi:MAG: roadblock/LC7 domain-containing protein [Methanomicrobiaceae archaeon]|nr:roadblock/LC7 domain-containing protein [Methanomicrobiaceae archaeon]
MESECKPGDTIQCPVSELLVNTADVAACVQVTGFGGRGVFLIENGEILAAYFKDDYNLYAGESAVDFLRAKPLLEWHLQIIEHGELSEMHERAIADDWAVSGSANAKNKSPEVMDDEKLRRIVRQPGVITVSAFFEGFPVQSVGKGDFEHVSAIAEDLLKEGTLIAHDLGFGDLDQLILETRAGKFIIAPLGDLFVCVHTAADANLGLIRMALKSVQ